MPTGVPLYIVHVSCEQAHEAIRRARPKGMRVYGEPLIQHLTLDESEYFNTTGSMPRGASCRRRSATRTTRTSLWAGLQAGTPAGRRHRSLRLHHRAEEHGPRRLPQDAERHRRARGPAADALDQRRRHRPADHERVRRRDLDQHRQDPERLSAARAPCVEGADADIVVWDPKLSKTITAATQTSIIDYNVFEGFKVTALPRYTLSRGEVVWADGQNSQPRPAAAGSSSARPSRRPIRPFRMEGADDAAAGRARSDQHADRRLRPYDGSLGAAAASPSRATAADDPVIEAEACR